MKKVISAIALLSVLIPAFAATAFFTGRQEMVQTVTFQTGWKCEYNYNGQTFWRVFVGSCPARIEVQ